MKVRKIVAGLAAVSMLAAFSAQAVFAAETVTISADKVTAAAGSEFTMNVELSGVPAAGISVCEFALTYDSALVTVKDVTVGAIADKGADGAEQFEGANAFESDYTTTAGVINVSYTTGLDDSVYWITEDGVMLTITGTVSADAADGASTEFAIGAIQRDTAGGSGVTNTAISVGNVGADYTVTRYEAAVSNGSVTVEAQGTTDDSTDTSGGEIMYGDSNCDGEVNISDVLTLNKNLLAGEPLTDQGRINADVDLDGTPTSADALNILKYTVKILTELPV